MCDTSFNKPWSRYYTLWRREGPQNDILPRVPQNLSAALRPTVRLSGGSSVSPFTYNVNHSYHPDEVHFRHVAPQVLQNMSDTWVDLKKIRKQST